ITLFAFFISLFFLARSTTWGRQCWALTGAYFSPKRSWKPILGLCVILLLTLFAVRMDVLFSMWYNTMYTSLQDLNEATFWFAMWLFAILASIHVIRALVDYYIQQSFTIHWRQWLNEHLLSRWLDNQS